MKLSINEAISLIYKKIQPLQISESVPLMKAYKRISAQNIYAKSPIPEHSISLRDGFAYLKNGSFKPILTGQKVPKDALCVVAKERINEFDPQKIDFNFIKPKGEDIKLNSLVLKSGQIIGSFDITNLASLGIGSVEVIKQARVAYLGIGDELIDLDEPKTPNKLYNSNGFTMANRGELMGAKTLKITNTLCDKKAVLQRLKSFEGADFIVTSGAMSDLINELLGDELEVLFSGVAMAPAGMSAVSFFNSTPILHLSGLPMASSLGFEVLGGAIIRALYNTKKLNSISAKIAGDIEANTHSQKIIPGFFDGEFFYPKHAFAAKINILNHCNGYIISHKTLKDDDRVKFYPFLLF